MKHRDIEKEIMPSDKIFEGFDRVVINELGLAVSQERAFRLGVVPSVGFMRADGWSLGAPREFESVAQKMWADEWTHIVRAPNPYWLAIN